MTVIRPNSISGITSITAQANEINVFRSDGTLAGLQLNGVNFNNTSGISTLAALNVTGNVSVGGTLTYQDVTNVDSVGIITAQAGINVSGGTGTFAGDILIADKIVHTGDTNTSLRFPAADTITAETGGSEALRINSVQKVLIGSDTIRNIGGASAIPHIQLEGTTANTSSLAIINNQDNTNSPVFSFGKTRGTSDGAVTTVADGDNLGSIKFCGADGTDIENATANIKAIVNGTVAGNQIPTDLIFETSATGSSGRSEKLRITSSGLVGIATASPATPLHVYHASLNEVARFSSGDATCYISFRDSASNATSTNTPILGAKTDDMFFQTGGSERVRIDSSGRVGVNQSSFATSDTMFSVSETTGHCEIGIISKNDSGAVINMGDPDSYNQGRIKYDNSDNSLTFRTTGSDRLRISSEGYVTKPSQPCAVVYQCTGPAGGLADSSSDNGEPLHFDHVSINQGGMIISNDNARIQVPVTGIYFVSYMVSGTVTTVDLNDGIELLLLKNGSEYPSGNSGAEPVFNFGAAANQEEFFCNNTLLVSLTAGDYVEAAVTNIGSSDGNINRGNFSVMLMA